MKISDLEKIKDKIKAGFTREFNDREDGYKGLKKLYGFELPDIKEFEPKLRYVAVQNGDINLIDAYSTDSELAKYNLVVLEDDKKLFPPYQGAPLLRKDTLKKYPQLETILGKLQDKITDAEMREMNYEVGVDGKRAEDIAREYLKKNGLIKQFIIFNDFSNNFKMNVIINKVSVSRFTYWENKRIFIIFYIL